MDRSRRANRAGHEKTFQYKSPQEKLLDSELIEDKLTQLLDFVAKLERTPEGAAEIKRRCKSFGACKRGDGETSGEFYAKLRHWLDRDIPQTKLPLHPPRQTDSGAPT